MNKARDIGSPYQRPWPNMKKRGEGSIENYKKSIVRNKSLGPIDLCVSKLNYFRTSMRSGHLT